MRKTKVLHPKLKSLVEKIDAAAAANPIDPIKLLSRRQIGYKYRGRAEARESGGIYNSVFTRIWNKQLNTK